MNWIVLLMTLGAVIVYWRLPSASARRSVLLVSTLALAGYLIWQLVPGLDQRPLDRLIGAIGFFSADVVLIGLTIWIARRVSHGQPQLIWPGLLILIGVFVLTKWSGAWSAVQQPILTLFNQSADQAIPIGAWLGISYLLFRLIHVLLESRKGRFADVGFRDLIIYALFPPALISGPIDRFPRFKSDLGRVAQPFTFDYISQGAWRILIGAFKKFVIADYLAKLPLDLAQYPGKTPWLYLWLVLYAYGLWLYFDFAGYTDMALGVARLLGFSLPENFDAPYLKSNLARFWQSWHITLSFWLRDYIFFPLGKTLRQKTPWLPLNIAVLISHLVTMIAIGLWHGFAWTFVIWGAWHGVGLFIVKVWGDFTRAHGDRLKILTRWPKLTTAASVFITFNFVMLGWVFFGAHDAPSAVTNFGRLFGLRL